jgi:hypothetical protein
MKVLIQIETSGDSVPMLLTVKLPGLEVPKPFNGIFVYGRSKALQWMYLYGHNAASCSTEGVIEVGERCSCIDKHIKDGINDTL